MLWLIRHGESLSNAGGRTASPGSITLTEKGFSEAQALTDKINDKPDLIVTSPYIRTKQTAAPIIAKYPDVPVEEWNVFEFTFLSPKTCVNTTTEERQPRVKKYWELNDPNYQDGEDSESFNQFIGRVKALINTDHRNKLIMVFTHGFFMKATLLLIENKGIISMQELKSMDRTIANTEIIKIDKFYHF